MKHTYVKRFSCLPLCLALLCITVLGACGRKQTSRNEGYSSETVAATVTANSKGDSFYYEASDSVSAAPTVSSSGSQTAVSSQKLIRSLSYSLETQDFEASVQGIVRLVAGCGGYVESSSVNGGSQGKSRYASYVLRIPSDRLDGFAGELSGLGNVLSSSENVQDVTLSYTDLSSRIKALETQRDALLEMLEKAKNLDDMLTIRDYLSDVEYELENYASQLRYLESKIDYSSVNLSLREVITYTEPEPESFLDRLLDTFRNSLSGCGEFLTDAVIAILGNLPALLLMAALLFFPLRLLTKKLKARKIRRAASKEASTSEAEA